MVLIRRISFLSLSRLDIGLDLLVERPCRWELNKSLTLASSSDNPPRPRRAQHPRRPQQDLQDLRLRPLQEPQRHRQRDVRAEDQGEWASSEL